MYPIKGDRVLKVGSIHDQWPAYILWAAGHTELGKHAPKVFHMSFKRGFYCATMERLKPARLDNGLMVDLTDMPYHSRQEV